MLRLELRLRKEQRLWLNNRLNDELSMKLWQKPGPKLRLRPGHRLRHKHKLELELKLRLRQQLRLRPKLRHRQLRVRKLVDKPPRRTYQLSAVPQLHLSSSHLPSSPPALQPSPPRTTSS